jgi:hypothetical protein
LVKPEAHPSEPFSIQPRRKNSGLCNKKMKKPQCQLDSFRQHFDLTLFSPKNKNFAVSERSGRAMYGSPPVKIFHSTFFIPRGRPGQILTSLVVIVVEQQPVNFFVGSLYVLHTPAQMGFTANIPLKTRLDALPRFGERKGHPPPR